MSTRSKRAANESRAPSDDESPNPRSHGLYQCSKCRCRFVGEVSSDEAPVCQNGSCDGSLVLTRAGTMTPCGDSILQWVEAPVAYTVH